MEKTKEIKQEKSLKNKAIDIKGKSYVLVADRVIYFNETYPNGSINTKLLSELNSETVVMKAVIIPDLKFPTRFFSGYSQAKWGEGNVNRTSALENCETSAVGRALAMMGIGVIDSVASVDEMNKAGVSEQSIAQKENYPAKEQEPKQWTSREPAATQKQVNYLKKLMEELELPVADDKTIFGWGIKKVSDLISQYKEEIDDRAINGKKSKIEKDTEIMEKAAEEKGVPFVSGNDVPDEEYEKDQVGDVW
jgi:hypothetical protein